MYVLNILNMLYTLRFFFPLQNAVCFIMLTSLVPVLFTFYIEDVLKFKKNNSGAKGLIFMLNILHCSLALCFNRAESSSKSKHSFVYQKKFVARYKGRRFVNEFTRTQHWSIPVNSCCLSNQIFLNLYILHFKYFLHVPSFSIFCVVKTECQYLQL